MSHVPTDLKYTEEHEWIRTEGGTVTVGITDFAQKTLGDIVFFDLPSVGKVVEAGDSVGTVESVKAASDLFCPVGGEIVAVNEEAVESPDEVNSDPYGMWLYKVKAGPGSFENLLDAKAYQKLVDGE
ncbi:glycine cleavage system protein GcvH [Streptomyces sp. NPDC006172]|uniref:glycine cleavage system protein GcvH n=1 Tax=Streptomyces sp. NPDC006172 TaxID=3154470 RepID=UPI0033CD121A